MNPTSRTDLAPSSSRRQVRARAVGVGWLRYGDRIRLPRWVSSDAGHPLLAARALLGVAVAFYATYLFSPLRLNRDAVEYLWMAYSAVDGAGFPDSRYPIGYPALLAGLDRAGLGVSWAFVALNLGFLALGLAATFRLLREVLGSSHEEATSICALPLFSFVFVKHAAIPIADIAFFGLSTTSLYAMVLAARCTGPCARYYVAISAAVLLVAATLSVRTAGLALIPAMLLCMLPGRRGNEPSQGALTSRGEPGARLVVSFAILAVALLLTQGFGLLQYVRDLTSQYAQYGVLDQLTSNLGFKLSEFGEIAVNAPRSRLPRSLWVALPVIGTAGLVLTLLGIWRRRRKLGVLELYFLSYLLMLVAWPASDSRLWLPVIPMMMAWVTTALQTDSPSRAARNGLLLYLSWFCASGGAAMYYSSYQSFSGDAFPDRYGMGGALTPTYRLAFDRAQSVDGEQDIDSLALRMLRRFEPRARLVED